MSYAAYANAQKSAETPRDLEIRAISYITHKLAEANAPESDPVERIRALNGNVRLWNLLVNDLSTAENSLPDALKASYISLGLFAKRTSLAAMADRADLSVLIKINTDVLDALGHQRAAAA